MLAIHFFRLLPGTGRKEKDGNETVAVNGDCGFGFEFRCL